jgi:predicted butyrate kinase (DUF1464 family)
VKTISMVKTSLRKPREIILSGRLTRNPFIYEDIEKHLTPILPVRKLNPLPGARISKEAGQGYAIIGEGLAGGYFQKLIKHTRITEASGTALDWVMHPNLKKAQMRLHEAYRETIKPSWSRFKVSKLLR